MTSGAGKTSDDAEIRLTALRHDLRNDLATAMLAADILCSSTDDTVKRHATSIITSLEKARERLKQSKKPA